MAGSERTQAPEIRALFTGFGLSAGCALLLAMEFLGSRSVALASKLKPYRPLLTVQMADGLGVGGVPQADVQSAILALGADGLHCARLSRAAVGPVAETRKA